VVVPSSKVLIVAGLQVPVMPLIEVVDKTGATLFCNRGPIAEKTGAIGAKISTSRVAAVALCPAVGVNV
jgi:hypothetical protein